MSSISRTPAILAVACVSSVLTAAEMGWTHFTIADPLPGTAWGTAGSPLVDLDGDGDLDVALSRRDAAGFYWYERRGDAEWVQHVICESPEIRQGLGATSLDVDQDGLPDLVFSGVWFRNPGPGRVRSVTSWELKAFAGGGHDLFAVDVNGDGDLDIVSKIWNKDGASYHADYWRNETVRTVREP